MFLLASPSRRDDAYWPEAKRAALDERYHSDFNRQDRFHDFDHRDRGRYPDHSADRSACSPLTMPARSKCPLSWFVPSDEQLGLA